MNKKTAILFLFILALAPLHADFTTPLPDYYQTYVQHDNSPLAQIWTQSTKEMNESLQSCIGTSNGQYAGVELFKYTFLALFIMAMAIALVYMAGNFFQVPRVIALAKQELNELAITCLVAIVFLAFLAPFTYSGTLLGFDVCQKATDYSYRMLDKVSTYSSVLITANIAVNSVYTLYVPLGPVRRAMTMQLGPALRPLIDAISFGLQFLITTYGEWGVFIFMFCFINKWFLVFFFPAGLFLRTFPQTRGGGNTLIGLAVALATIYPFMFYLDSLIFEKQFPSATSTLSANYFLDMIKYIISQVTLGTTASIAFGTLSILYISPWMVGAIMMAVLVFFDVMVDVLHLIVVFSILLPIMNIFVTLSFAREIAKHLGTEINLSAFAKLI
ncbi:MAG: hypothetical protein PHS02_00825 [Candidatus ainarchaeum sp.]|nr:hypothetical protein [Candidatus ainarchaeum sp.]